MNAFHPPAPAAPASAGQSWARCGRFRRRIGAACLAGAASLLAACGQAGLVEPEAPIGLARLLEPGAPRPGAPEEVLRASVEVFGLEIATIESARCGRPAEGATIETQVDAAPLVRVVRRTSGEARTELLGPGMPRSSDYTFRDGDVIRHYKVDYRAGGYAYVYDNGGIEQRAGHSDVPEGAEPHDLHSGLLLLRGWRPRLGEQAYFYVVLGRRPWRVEVTSRGPEMLKVGEDPRLSYRIDGLATRLWQPEKAASKRFSIWLSEDSERVPLRMVADASFGQVTLQLTDAEAGGACRERGGALAGPGAAPGDLRRPAGRVGRAWAAPRAPDRAARLPAAIVSPRPAH